MNTKHYPNRVILIFSPSPTHELYSIKTKGVETNKGPHNWTDLEQRTILCHIWHTKLYSYIRGTGCVSLYAYSGNNLTSDLFFNWFLNIYICHLGQQKFVLGMIHSRIPDFKNLSTVTTVTDHWSNKICRCWDSF